MLHPDHNTDTPTRYQDHPKPRAAVVDRVNECDRDYFRKNPNEPAYLRPFIPGELPDQVGPGLLDGWALVTSIASSNRSRQPVGRVSGKRRFPRRLRILVMPNGE